jgi:glucan endo-1,3-alpha-glucosidase
MKSILRIIMMGCLIMSLAQIAGAREHFTFAHFMVCMPFNGAATVESYKHEIQLAQQYGIDGFALNCGAWEKERYYVERSTMIYEAAKQLNSDFKLFFSIDTATGMDPLTTAMDMMKRFADHPNQFHYNGKPVLSAYTGPNPRWAETIKTLKDSGYESCFVPFFWTANYTLAPSYDGIVNTLTESPYLDGYFLFGIDTPSWDLRQGNRNIRRATAKMGKLQMATNSFAYNSANLRDFHGMKDYSLIWGDIISDNADWVEIVTWNDYNEDSHLAPAHNGGNILCMDHDESFLDVTAYYSAWFKSGTQPVIKQDKLYFVYRNRSKWLTTAYDLKKEAWIEIPDQIHDDVEDNIYATVMLTAPAELTIRTGKTSKKFSLPSGISHVELPFQPGTPRFTLRRKGDKLAEIDGQQTIISAVTKENSPNLRYIGNKTWSGAWCGGTANNFPGAKNGSTNINIPFKITPQTGACNIRIKYRNTGDLPCVVKISGTTAYNFFPVSLPPTKSGDKNTVSFIWTPFAPADSLNLSLAIGDANKLTVDAIEIVPVAPVTGVRKIETPRAEMVQIPAGKFIMGNVNGKPDEKPVHPVTISAFKMAKFEITNAEYELFDPAHRKYRDEYSWRDSDPVTYLSWRQAAAYCNWLSVQAGLTPAYDPKDWSVNLHAGYRMPTEAEWEYVASGRGEGRVYPWGDDKPDAQKCQTGTSTASVGSHPAGASRDGIHDLAGNLAEWCTDYYHPYTVDAVTDPCAITRAQYRVIRGGSWGYYNRSQRVTDREFNTQVYPGYYYIGFRVVLPE